MPQAADSVVVLIGTARNYTSLPPIGDDATFFGGLRWIASRQPGYPLWIAIVYASLSAASATRTPSFLAVSIPNSSFMMSSL